MDSFLTQSRSAFRRLYGLDPSATCNGASFEPARRNRVLGLWADTAVSEQWTRAMYGQARYTARLSEELERIVDALAGSVEALRLVKGPALEKQAWPQLGLRSFDDLDFRCAKHSLPALIKGLSVLGYEVKAQSDAHRDGLWHFGWGLEFRHPDGMMVEFNHRMFPPHFPWPDRLTFRCPERWAPLQLNQNSVLCPDPSLHLLLACVHAAWHGWERLGWIADIAGLLVRHPHCLTDAEQLTNRNSFACRALYAGCMLAGRFFGPLPGINPPPAEYEKLTEEVIRLITRLEPDISMQTQRRIHSRLMSTGEHLGYTLRRLFIPGDPDFRKWELASEQQWLYWILRPLRKAGSWPACL